MTDSISAEEVALYDRQIRLWGVEAQTRMRNAKILVVNVGALAAETIKNLVLAGVGQVSLIDSATVTADHLGANFFLTDGDIGSNRAHSALPRIQKLNPRVVTEALTNKAISDLSSELVAKFDVVVATELGFADLVKINALSRQAKVPFYAAGSFGVFGYVFADLIYHTFTVDRVNSNTPAKPGPETDTRSVVSTVTKKEGTSITQVVTKTESYEPLESVTKRIDGKFAALSGRQKAKVNPALPLLLALWEYEAETSHDASLSEPELLQRAEQKATMLGLSPDIVGSASSLFYSSIGAEFSPVAAILGGVLGQNILNYTSQKLQPIQNILIYNGLTNEGPIYAL